MFRAVDETKPLVVAPEKPGTYLKFSEIKKSIPEPIREIDGRPLTHQWSFQDYLGAFLARTSSRRNDYRVAPGLYAFGNPGEDSEVLVSCNYKYSFDLLRKNIKDKSFWILVLDTKGINVWCAAGKGTFGTKELIDRIQKTGLIMHVKHRRLIVPQLGAVGIAAHEIKKATGFRVSYGPVDLKDLLTYLDNNRKTTPAMRRVRFNWYDRLVLVPMEVIPVLKHYGKYALVMLLVFGLQSEGFLFQSMLTAASLYLAAGFLAIVSGAILTPLFLPILPFRAFAAKGAVAGAAMTAAMLFFLEKIAPLARLDENIWFAFFAVSFIPALSSYLALQFTGSSTYTNMSGVYKEHRFAIPLYKAALALSLFFLIVHKLSLHINFGAIL